jgi:hypothetical protein
MGSRILAAGLDVRELRLEVRFLQRTPELVRDVPSVQELLHALDGDGAELVVVGPQLADSPVVEAVRRIRHDIPGRHVSILGVIPAKDPIGSEGVMLAAGANAVLRRPLDRFVLESWVSKLVNVPRRVLARIPVHVQVVSTSTGSAGT